MTVVMPVRMRVSVGMRFGVAVRVVVRMAVALSVVLVAMVVVVMVVAAAARGAVLMMTMRVVMVVMSMLVTVIVAVMLVPVAIVAVIAALVGALLWAEGAGHFGRGRAEAAHHLQQHVVVADIERVLADLRGDMAVADMPGDLHQPQRVVGRDLDEALGGGLDLHEAPVLQLHRVAVVENGRAVEVEEEGEAALGGQRDAPAVARFVVEGQRVGDPLGLHGGAAEDGGGAEHGGFLLCPEGRAF